MCPTDRLSGKERGKRRANGNNILIYNSTVGWCDFEEKFGHFGQVVPDVLGSDSRI